MSPDIGYDLIISAGSRGVLAEHNFSQSNLSLMTVTGTSEEPFRNDLILALRKRLMVSVSSNTRAKPLESET